MEEGYLSHYFEGVASKKLTTVEVDTTISNQHEFNGVRDLKLLFGAPVSKIHIDSRFMYFSSEAEPVIVDGILTWYDSRANHPTRTEWRLYYPSNDVTERMSADDTLFICKLNNDSALVIITMAGSSFEAQLNWLFGFHYTDSRSFSVKQKSSLSQSELEYASRIILNEIGIEAQDYVLEYLEPMIERFNGEFPSTRMFSDFARGTLRGLNAAIDDPDDVLLTWLEREDKLFRTFEKYIISARLEDGFVINDNVDVDSFISFSLSVQNRRKSRAGHSLENHIENLLKAKNISYTRNPITENRSRPDFIFPCIEAYRDENYPENNLTMLGVKSTCKDRWRQVLTEADRIGSKHLLTLEAAISENQTEEMKDRNLQLVIPRKIQSSYTELQKNWLFTVNDFLQFVKGK
jgi:hypothetical protein